MSSFVERRGIIASPFGPYVFLIKRSWLRARNACAAAGTGGFVIHHIDHVMFTGRDRLNANVHNSVGATLARTFCGWNQHVASAPALVNEVDKLLFPTLESSLRPRAMGIILHKFHPGVDVQLAAVSAARQRRAIRIEIGVEPTESTPRKSKIRSTRWRLRRCFFRTGGGRCGRRSAGRGAALRSGIRVGRKLIAGFLSGHSRLHIPSHHGGLACDDRFGRGVCLMFGGVNRAGQSNRSMAAHLTLLNCMGQLVRQ